LVTAKSTRVVARPTSLCHQLTSGLLVTQAQSPKYQGERYPQLADYWSRWSTPGNTVKTYSGSPASTTELRTRSRTDVRSSRRPRQRLTARAYFALLGGWQTSVTYPPPLSATKLADRGYEMESSARSIERAQPSGIVLLLTLLSSSGYSPPQQRSEASGDR